MPLAHVPNRGPVSVGAALKVAAMSLHMGDTCSPQGPRTPPPAHHCCQGAQDTLGPDPGAETARRFIYSSNGGLCAVCQVAQRPRR